MQTQLQKNNSVISHVLPWSTKLDQPWQIKSIQKNTQLESFQIQYFKQLIEEIGKENPESSMAHFKERKSQLAKVQNENGQTISRGTRSMEIEWRSLDSLFSNTDKDALEELGITIVSTSKSDLQKSDGGETMKIVKKEIEHYRRRYDLQKVYTLLCIAGYLLNKSLIHLWAKIAAKYGLLMATDFKDVESYEELLVEIKKTAIAGGEDFLSHVIMSCNYPLAREQYQGIDEDLYTYPSAPLMGLIHGKKPMSQTSAGKMNGALKALKVSKGRMDLLDTHISRIAEMGMIPIGYWDYKTPIAWSGRTLCQSNLPGKRVYPIVRVFNHVSLTIADLINRNLFQNEDEQTLDEIKLIIVKYLEDLKWKKKVFKDYQLLKFEMDPDNPGKLICILYLKPFNGISSCTLQMVGMDGASAPVWETRISDKKG